VVSLATIGAAMGVGLVNVAPALAVQKGKIVASTGPHVLLRRDRVGKSHTNTGPLPLIDYGGEILPTTHVYTIWWGDQSQWASDVQSGMSTFFSNLNGSSYVNTANQYMRGGTESVTYVDSRSDPSAPPKKAISNASQLADEIVKLYGKVDPEGFYAVFTSNFPQGGPFCAWHQGVTVNNTPISVAYLPNMGLAGRFCDPGDLYGLGSVQSEDFRSIVNVTAHEFMESITDPQLDAWKDKNFLEIGDKCAWTFSAPVTLGNTQYQLQEEWSNAANECVQATP
jgi:hypothetical protein